MAETKKDAAEGAKKQEEDAPKFAVDDLIARSTDFLGVQPFIAAGGLAKAKGPLTIADAKSRVADWLEQPVTKEA